MLKKVAYVVITSGLFLAPLGASAMVVDPTFPICVGPSCASALADASQEVSSAASSESMKQADYRKTRGAEQERTSDSAFPEDNSKD